ncbi:MAG TPA: DUF1571 domain-containing protein [Fimbriiglobus sp.]|nr:DUF1571 domain-containing protein [Fimbriiglobus sp.]
MYFRRTLCPVALVAIAVLFGGCTRSHARRDVARDLRPQPARELAREPVAAPVPPTPPPQPPAEPPVAPPRTDTLSGIIPPMPDGRPTPLTITEPPPGVPPTVPDSPVIQAGGVADPEADADRKKREQRREERKDRREQRREDHQAPAADTTKAPEPAAPVPEANDSAAAVRKLVDASARRYAEVPDFACRLVKQEVVKGKQLPKDEVEYRFRQKPLSVYMKTLSEAGQGREVMYVQGQFDDRIHLITGKGDNRIVGAGFKTSLDPTDSRATAKSRYRITEAGLGRTITGLQEALASQGMKGGCGVKALGLVKRPEYPYPLEGVEVRTNNGGSTVILGGGTRQVFFDPKPDSPSHLLPVVVVTKDMNGREVEYYSFTHFKVPAGTTDADWDPARLGK